MYDLSRMERAEELRYLILGAQREGARALTELLRPAGLTAAQGEVLAVVAEANRPLSVRQIGERLVCEGGVQAGSLPASSMPVYSSAASAPATAERWSCRSRPADGPALKLSGTRSTNCMSGSLLR